MLPDAVQQGLGWQPQPLQPLPDYGGLPPEVAQAIGLAPPVAPPAPDLAPPPPIPQQLPSAAEQPPPEPSAPQQPTHPDYAAPAPAAPPPVAAPKPAKAPTPDQQLANVQQRQAQADQASLGAIRGQEAVSRAKAADDLAAYQQHDVQAKAIEAQRKAQADEYAKVHATKQAYVDSTLKDVDNYKVDQNKYWKEAGVGDHIGWYVAMALSSFGDALQRKSGPNPIVQMLQDKMHQSVVAQMDEREQLKQKNVRAEHALDKYDAFSQSRDAQIALLDSRNDRALANQLMTAAAKYADPMAVARADKEVAELFQSSAAKAKEAAQFAAGYDTQKKQLAVAQGHLAEEKRKNLVQEGWQQYKFNEEQNLKAAALLAKQQGKLSDEESKRAIFVSGPDGNKVAIRNQKGDLVLAGSAEIAQKQRDMVAAAEAYNRLVGQMSRGIAEHGGESTFIAGADWQKMMSDLQSATAELHDAYGITAFREPTVKFFEKMASAGVDPTSFVRDARAALQQSNMNLQAKMNEKLGSIGYDGPPIKFVDTTSPPTPTATPEDQAIKIAMGKRSDAPEHLPGELWDEPVEKDLARDPVRGTEGEQYVQLPAPQALGPSQKRLLDNWAAMLSGDDPKLRDRAASILGGIAGDTAHPNGAEDPALREYARQILNANIAPSIQGSPEQVR